MEICNQKVESNQDTEAVSSQFRLAELSELQLALIGGGVGEVVFA